MRNTVHLGDCLEIMQQIPSGSVDMILCDLPYGTTACKWDTVIPFVELWAQYERVIKDNGAIVLTASQPFTSALVMSNTKMFKYEWIWHKNMTSGFALARKQPMRNHESVLIFYRRQPFYNYIKEPRDLNEASEKRFDYAFSSEKGTNEINGGIKKVAFIPESLTHRYPTTVKKFDSVPTSANRLHPTQKPVPLFEYLIKTYTNEGDIVLDNCAGSGTTAIACLNTGRDYILIEKEPDYYNIIQERIAKARAKQASQLFAV